MLTLLIVLLVLAMLFSAPAWPHSRGWGYYPSGGLGLVLVIRLLFVFLRPIRRGSRARSVRARRPVQPSRVSTRDGEKGSAGSIGRAR